MRPTRLPCRSCQSLNERDANRCPACGAWLPHEPVWGLAIVAALVLLCAVVAEWIRHVAR